jgi:hypothetical protein
MLQAVHRQYMLSSLRFLFLSILIFFSLGLASVTGLSSTPAAHAASRDWGNGGTYWPPNQALPTFAQAHYLDVVDLRQASNDEALTFSTLQGIINRKEPRIYLFQSNPDEGYFAWLNDMKIPYVIATDPWQVVLKYIHEVKGVIIYDPNLLDSSNVGVTLAGLQDGLVVSPDEATKLEAAPYNLPVLDDLRGKWSTPLDAYTWEFQNLWPKTTHRMLIGLPSSTSITIPSDNWKNFQTVKQVTQPVTDSSNRAVYDLDLSSYLGGSAVYLRFQDAYPNDGWGPSVHQVTAKADGQVIAQFTPCTSGEDSYITDHGGSSCDTSSDAHRFADGGSYFVYRFVPPAGTKQFIVSVDMWNEFLVSASSVAPALSSDQQIPDGGLLRDYAVANRAMVFWLRTSNTQETALFTQILSSVQPGTPYLGWFENENAGVTLTSAHAVQVYAADFFNNLTVFSGAHAPILRPRPAPVLPLQNKIYVTFTVSDGDNLQYDQHRMRVLWDNSARGSVPLNWTISPVIYDAAPFILSHYQQTASPNDLLIAGPDGNGYYYPSLWPQSNLPTFLHQSEAYMQKTGMNIIDAIDLTPSLQPAVAQAYSSQMRLNGMFYYNDNGGDSTSTTVVSSGLPISTEVIISNESGGLQEVQQVASTWDGKSPMFISVLLDAWDTTPADASGIAQSLASNSNYSFVRGDQFFQLFRKANNLPFEG